MADHESLDFKETLDVLTQWERRRVTVSAFTQPSDNLAPRSRIVLHGRLGAPRLGRLGIPTRFVITAFFPLGPARPGDSPRNGFLLRSDEFVDACELNSGHLDIESTAGLHVEIKRG